MPPQKRRLFRQSNFVGGALLIGVLLLVAAGPVTLTIYAPHLAGWIFVLLLLCAPVATLHHRWRQEGLIGHIAPKITPGIAAEYRGIYSQGFEVNSVIIATGRRHLLVFPIIESWNTVLPRNTVLPPARPHGSNAVRSYHLRFIGTPGQPGRYGHMGIDEREARIHQVLSIEPLEEQ